MMDEFYRILFEVNSLNALINAYTVIAGVSLGFINTMIDKHHFSKEDAEKLIMQIDKMARDKVDEGYREYLRRKEGAEE